MSSIPASNNLPTILLVDDISANLELLISYLSDSYNTPTAKNGVRALKRLKVIKPDLILLDIQMPEMDGYETCRRIKENEETKDIPVIFMSALSETVDKVKGFKLGAVDYITKPVDRSELRARINSHITLYKMKRELEEKNRILQDNALQQKRVEQIMRHDLKSPLQAIVAIPELILDHYDTVRDPEEVSLLHDLASAGESMLEMIDSSLTLYKMEKGIYTVETVAVDLLPILTGVASSISYKERGAVFTTLLNSNPAKSGDSCSVLGEKTLIYSLFSNLLKNAAEASPKTEEIIINVERGDFVKVTITNSGEVPPEIKERFFEEMTTSGKQYGTGLGTYSAKMITETLGGTISLDSSVKGKTSISVALPRA